MPAPGRRRSDPVPRCSGKRVPVLKKLSLVLALLGLLLGTALIGWSGAGAVVRAVLSVGWGGFGLYYGWQWLMFVPLGLAWDTIARGRGVRRARVFIGGRMVRDAASNC